MDNIKELINMQTELEKEMVSQSVKNYIEELEKSKQNGTFGCTNLSIKLISQVLRNFICAINLYMANKPHTISTIVMKRLNDTDSIAFIASKIILNSLWCELSVQSVYKAIGQAIEYEFKMRQYKQENLNYYNSIQNDLNKRCAKPNRKKTVTAVVFKNRLNFHIEKWSNVEKFQTGLVLLNLFVKSTNFVEFEDTYERNKHIKKLIPTKTLVELAENMKDKLKVMQPFFLPMVCPPKNWISVFEGGYISPYLMKNKLIKNNDKDYLTKLETIDMPLVYDAINHLQSTKWQINKKVLETAETLWEKGLEIAKLPSRYDEKLIPFPYPEKSKTDTYTKKEIEVVKMWKRDTYEIHKRNVKQRSVRLSTVQILNIANQFKDYEKIWFPYQMDFRGRMYPIPVLLQPQGNDLAKGLLRFAKGKKVDKNSINYLKIHGANVWGYDKESYDNRIKWVENRHSEIQSYAKNPLENRGWADADKPFQFLAFCFEYSDYLNSPSDFETHIPVLLDGTCNGLQHYSALLRDKTGANAVNLINSPKPNDIYSTVANRLKEKLSEIVISKKSTDFDKNLAKAWLDLGVNRKLTKRPVMVLPYGGTIMSCREYISDYLVDNFSLKDLQKSFKLSDIPKDNVFISSVWLSKLLWQSITEIIRSAVLCMDYIKKTAKITAAKDKYLEWVTPVGLTIRQGYFLRKKREIKTELYGSILKTIVNIDIDKYDIKRQLNGICPNFIHSMDAACLMIYINKCKKVGISSIMSVHDCYGTHAADTELSAKLLREAFVEIYKQPIIEKFLTAISQGNIKSSEMPQKGDLDINEVLTSDYFFN